MGVAACKTAGHVARMGKRSKWDKNVRVVVLHANMILCALIADASIAHTGVYKKVWDDK